MASTKSLVTGAGVWLILAGAPLSGQRAVAADIAYYLSQNIGGFSVAGDILTDGTLGSFNPISSNSNIVGWNLQLTAGIAGSFTLSSTSGNSTFQNQAQLTNGFSATSTQLFYNFSSGGGSYFQGELGGFMAPAGPQFVLCFQAATNICQGGHPSEGPLPAGEGIAVYGLPPFLPSQLTPMTGTQPIASTAILPVSVTSLGAFKYDMPVLAGSTYFVDPQAINGYSFSIGSGDPNFASVLLPAVQSDPFDVSFIYNGVKYSDVLASLTVLDFPAGGVSQFTVTGIDPSDGIDPDDTSAFVTGLTFASDGTFTGTQTPLTATVAVPEPSTWALMLAGFGGLGFLGYRKTKTRAKLAAV